MTSNKSTSCCDTFTSSVTSYAYAHDRLGRVVSRNGDAFGYDARSQVVSATVSTNAYGYSYDSIGNSVHASRNAATNYYLSNELNQYEVVGDGADFSFLYYDWDGNLEEWGGDEFEWDPENRLRCGWRNGSEVYSAFRDWNGRAFCEIEETFYADRVFDGWNPVFERAFDIYSELPLSETVYVWGTDLSGSLQGAGGVGGLLAVNRDGDWYVPLYDANGNVTAYVSEGGSVVAEYEYDAFGNTISQSGAMSDDFRHRFSTKPWIAPLSVYDYGERIYSPQLRRWLSRDPVGEEGGVNLYAMCGNDAVNGVDVIGRVKWEGILTLSHRECHNLGCEEWNLFSGQADYESYYGHFFKFTFGKFLNDELAKLRLNPPLKIPNVVRKSFAAEIVAGLGMKQGDKETLWEILLQESKFAYSKRFRMNGHCMRNVKGQVAVEKIASVKKGTNSKNTIFDNDKSPKLIQTGVMPVLN